MRFVLLTLLALVLIACREDGSSRHPSVDVHRLAEQGQTAPLLAVLVPSGNLDQRDVCYRTPLMFAAQFGRTDTVRELLAAGAQVNLHEKGYYSALMLAAGNGHADVVRLLADAGAKVDDVEITRGWTALIWSAKRGHYETVATLLELGADPGQRDRQGRSAGDWARSQGHAGVAALLHTAG